MSREGFRREAAGVVRLIDELAVRVRRWQRHLPAGHRHRCDVVAFGVARRDVDRFLRRGRSGQVAGWRLGRLP